MFVRVGEFEAAAEIADADAVTAAVFLFFGEVAVFGFKYEFALELLERYSHERFFLVADAVLECVFDE
jgi:hypothetical protein